MCTGPLCPPPRWPPMVYQSHSPGLRYAARLLPPCVGTSRTPGFCLLNSHSHYICVACAYTARCTVRWTLEERLCKNCSRYGLTTGQHGSLPACCSHPLAVCISCGCAVCTLQSGHVPGLFELLSQAQDWRVDGGILRTLVRARLAIPSAFRTLHLPR